MHCRRESPPRRRGWRTFGTPRPRWKPTPVHARRTCALPPRVTRWLRPRVADPARSRPASPRPRPAQFYGSREPDHADRRWLRARGQRAGRRGCHLSDDRRPTGDPCAQRLAVTRTPGCAEQGKHRPTGVRGTGRCRLLLGRQSPGTEAAAYPGLRGHRSAPTRARRGRRKPSRTRRDSHTSQAGEAPTGRASQSIPEAHTDGGTRLGQITQAQGCR